MVVGFGATFAESILFPVAMSLDKRHLPYVHRLQLAINQWMATPALIVVLATGIYQTTDGDWDFGAFWISASRTIVILLGALIGAYFIPADERLGPMVAAEPRPLGKASRSYRTSISAERETRASQAPWQAC